MKRTDCTNCHGTPAFSGAPRVVLFSPAALTNPGDGRYFDHCGMMGGGGW